MIHSHYLSSARRGNPRKPPVSMLLGFSPFVLFVLLANISIDLALWAAFATAFAVGIHDFAQERTLRVLDVGSTVLFGTLALYAGFIQPSLTLRMARLVADSGLFAIALLSIVLRNPFTLQYARDQVPKEIWRTPRFIRTNYLVTGIWMLAFAATAAADAYANIDKKFPLSLDIAGGLVALVIALAFTARYPAWLRAHADASARAP